MKKASRDRIRTLSYVHFHLPVDTVLMHNLINVVGAFWPMNVMLTFAFVVRHRHSGSLFFYQLYITYICTKNQVSLYVQSYHCFCCCQSVYSPTETHHESLATHEVSFELNACPQSFYILCWKRLFMLPSLSLPSWCSSNVMLQPLP